MSNYNILTVKTGLSPETLAWHKREGWELVGVSVNPYYNETQQMVVVPKLKYTFKKKGSDDA